MDMEGCREHCSCILAFLPSFPRTLDSMSLPLTDRDNGHRPGTLGLLFHGRGPFRSCDNGMTSQNLNNKPVGLSLWGILAERCPVQRSEAGKGEVMATKALGRNAELALSRTFPANCACMGVPGSSSSVWPV